MSVSSNRLRTMRTLVGGARIRSGLHSFDHIDHELLEAGRVRRVTPEKRRHLLQIFHGMRALESALKEILRSYHITPRNSLGDVLHQMRNLPASHPAHLNTRQFNMFMRSVRVERNRLMHQANCFPRSARAAEHVFGEIAACFSILVK